MTLNKRTLNIIRIYTLLISVLLAMGGCTWNGDRANTLAENSVTAAENPFPLENIPAFSGEVYIEVNGNVPYFEEEDYTTESFESYSDLDTLGRCGVAYANIGIDLMPTKEREEIGMIKPSGWHTIKYDCVEKKYLYNRSHLIGYQLTGENANERNLITGTRYMNAQGMLPFENIVASYVKQTGNHVLYRVTPIFKGDNLLAQGVLMEGWSVEDGGESICYNVFVYNVQPGIEIDYATGESRLTDSAQTIYILNTNSKKFHYSTCLSVQDMSEKNKQEYRGDRENLIMQGYVPCGSCKP
ncbi:MAG: DNA/RNA non-specific endonuclease [Acetatifactor sp.]